MGDEVIDCVYNLWTGFVGKATCEAGFLRCEEKFCPAYTPMSKPKPQTNADRIRQMSDEELADMLVDIGECDRRCPAKLGDCIFSDSSCRSAWIGWLKSTVNLEAGK